MRRIGLQCVVFLMFLPATASATRLEWFGGVRNLEVTSARRCTLMVTPSPGASLLPPRWRLYWTGSAAVERSVQFLSATGPSEAAPVCAVRSPGNDEDRLSNTSTVEFCGDDPAMPTARAAYVLLLDPSLHARFRVEEPTGSLVASEDDLAEVTVNGGDTAEYPAALRFVTPLEDSAGIKRAGVTGRGLDRVRKAWMFAPEAESPTDSLEILTQTATTLTLRVPEQLGSETTLVLSNGEGEAASASSLIEILGYDPEVVGGARMLPAFPLEAKDFAFLYWNNQFHLFYMWIDPSGPDSLESLDIRHAVSTNLYNWTQLPPVIPVRPGKWDDGHIWAPTIVQSGGTFHMYYTGVSKDAFGDEGVQRIGHASSTDLMNWTRDELPALTCSSIPWTSCDPLVYEGRQFRDPFTMVDPGDATRHLMYFVSRLGVDVNQQIVGAADTHNLNGAWSSLTPLWCTDGFFGNFLGYCESPHLFQHGSLWYLMFTDNSGHPIRFKVAPSPLADSTQWSGQYSLFNELGNDGNTNSWIASEFLHVGTKDYLAVVNRAGVTPGIEIREMAWGAPPHFTLAMPPVLAAPAAVTPVAIGLDWVSAFRAGGVTLRLDLPAPAAGRLDLFDVAGRFVARLNDGWLPSGSSQWTWDGRLQTGGFAGSGIYFARVRTSAASRSIRVALVR